MIPEILPIRLRPVWRLTLTALLGFVALVAFGEGLTRWATESDRRAVRRAAVLSTTHTRPGPAASAVLDECVKLEDDRWYPCMMTVVRRLEP